MISFRRFKKKKLKCDNIKINLIKAGGKINGWKFIKDRK